MRPGGGVDIEQPGAGGRGLPFAAQRGVPGERQQRRLAVASRWRSVASDHQRGGGRLVEYPAVLGEQAAGGAAGDFQAAGRARGGDEGGLRQAGVVAGEEEHDAVGAVAAGARQRRGDGCRRQFRGRFAAAGEAAGGLHAVLPA